MTLCVTFDALIKAVSDARDNYEWLNNGDGASESRRGGGTKNRNVIVYYRQIRSKK